jgi:hypothetical protein
MLRLSFKPKGAGRTSRLFINIAGGEAVNHGASKKKHTCPLDYTHALVVTRPTRADIASLTAAIPHPV